MDATCATCQKTFAAQRKAARFCSPKCRQKAQRRRDSGVSEAPIALEPPSTDGAVRTATLAELLAAGREATALGAACLALAERIDQRLDTGSALASAVGRLGDTLALATKGAKVADTRLDELRARRDAKRGA